MRLFFIFLLIITTRSQAQKHLNATMFNDAIHIDGILNEPIWQEADIATGFTQTTPVLGLKASQRTEVKVVYNQTSIFISAVLYDVNKDSITTTLSKRDDYGNADHFTVYIDTYGSSTIGFIYGVTSAGVQIDELMSPNGSDLNWNAVWESEVKVENNKWVVEMEIPFSALRFPNKEVQNWRINFRRGIRRFREESYWNPYDPRGYNFLSQLGYLDHVNSIEAPLRLAFMPYISGYVVNSNGQTNQSFNGGMDLKYGINDAFTLDMTLIPDFGQVQFDNVVLNLSPFEVRYNERRPFFTEGTELFNKAGLFYSRRVGSRPINANLVNPDSTEIVLSNPSATPLLNATKFSGRTKNGLGIGVFNGITKATFAEIKNTTTQSIRKVETAPLTNYNVVVLDQNLKHNSTITFTNTSVWRSGKTYDANVSALSFDLFNKKGTYKINGNSIVSQRYDETNNYGFRNDISLNKSSGKFKFGIDYAMADDQYNPNDIGFLSRNNFQNYGAGFYYNTYKPFWRLFKTWSSIYFGYNKLFKPDVYTSSGIYSNFGGLFKNYLSAGINANYYGITHDYFEARQPGRLFIIPPAINGGFFISSNYAKTFALDINGGYTKYFSNRSSINLGISPRYRLSDKIMLIYALKGQNSINEQGVALTTNFYTLTWSSGNPIFSERNRLTLTNTIEATYIFTNRMGLSFKLRHYWSKVNYLSFFELLENGSLASINYTGLDNDNRSLHNTNYNAFTIDLGYSWVFKRGSELSLVWKNSAFTSNQEVQFNYIENVNNLMTQPFTNSLSLKVLYYIDYFKTVTHFKNRKM
jgi:hypothetical protein